MKKVITMVGTSIFENYIKDKGDSTFSDYLETLKYKNMDNYENEKGRVGYMRNKLNKWISGINVCAEAKSIAKIAEETQEELEIYFLTSDTTLSNVAFEVIKENWEKFEKIKDYKLFPSDRFQATIKGLQVKNREKFVNEGMIDLINRIFQIAGEYWENVIINITAGYKATIPYLTILAQVFKCPIYYIFENTDTLIRIPYIPIDIKWDVFKENENFLFELEVNEIKEIPKEIELKDELKSLVEKVGGYISLNPLGIVLWEKYKKSFILFKISSMLNEYIKDKTRQKIVNRSLNELYRRLKENPSHPDLDHKLSNIELPPGFKTFKHKENNLQVRILYKCEEYTTRYKLRDYRIYVGLIKIGQEVHNAENEYVGTFERESQKVTDLENYKVYRIEKN